MKPSATLLAILGFVLLMQPPMHAQINHKPIFRFRVPTIGPPIPTQPLRFAVSAYDPDGDTLIYTWKLNGIVKQTLRDSSYLLIPSDIHSSFASLWCIFSDPRGLADSTFWFLGGDLYVNDDFQPSQLSLAQNFPNPFNPSTTITYQLPSAAHVNLKVYNALGALIGVLVDLKQASGTHEVRWTPNLPSGVYYCRLTAGSNVQTRKMILIK